MDVGVSLSDAAIALAIMTTVEAAVIGGILAPEVVPALAMAVATSGVAVGSIPVLIAVFSVAAIVLSTVIVVTVVVPAEFRARGRPNVPGAGQTGEITDDMAHANEAAAAAANAQNTGVVTGVVTIESILSEAGGFRGRTDPPGPGSIGGGQVPGLPQQTLTLNPLPEPPFSLPPDLEGIPGLGIPGSGLPGSPDVPAPDPGETGEVGLFALPMEEHPTVTPVPTPSSLALLLPAVLGLALGWVFRFWRARP